MGFKIEKRNSQEKSVRGTMVVELTIMLPFLIILLMGTMELSIVVHNKSVLANASREGARYGIAEIGGFKSNSDIQQRVDTFVKDRLISFSSADETTTVSRGGVSTPGQLRVKVNYPYHSLVLPRLVTDLTGPISLSAETKMQMEQ